VIVGVDGCPGGWVAVSKRTLDEAPTVGVYPDFEALLNAFPFDAIIAVDMPIGLPERATLGGRGAEQAVRPFLGARQSSVFSVPSRSAVYAETEDFENEEVRYAAHRRASQVALATSEPPRKISIQAFGLFPKIRQLDTALRGNKALKERVFECHPEFAFAILNGGASMREPKKIKGKVHGPGIAERKALLETLGFSNAFLNQSAPKGASADDFLDACVVMLIAGRIKAGLAKPYPDPPCRDAFGLPIAIWA
jgi:predicted RNase H-like nuclease